MTGVDNIVKTIEEQAKALAERLFKQYGREAVADVTDFLRKSEVDLERWIQELRRHEIGKDGFTSLVQGQIDVAQMRALKQAGLAQVQIDLFTAGMLDIIVSAAFAAIP
jgi:hypothetical protein